VALFPPVRAGVELVSEDLCDRESPAFANIANFSCRYECSIRFGDFSSCDGRRQSRMGVEPLENIVFFDFERLS